MNYSFHLISLGRREYPSTTQLPSPSLSTSWWDPGYLPPWQRGSRALKLSGVHKDEGESIMWALPAAVWKTRGMEGWIGRLFS